MRAQNSSSGHDEGSAAKRRRVVTLPQIKESVSEFLETIDQMCGPKSDANSTGDSSSRSSSIRSSSSSSSCSRSRSSRSSNSISIGTLVAVAQVPVVVVISVNINRFK